VRRTPALLSSLLRGLGGGWTDAPDVEGGRRPRDVVGHLISAELDRVHDLDNVSQVFAGLAGSHDAEVRPWKADLGILLRHDDPSAAPD
jgi:hypothetical protein